MYERNCQDGGFTVKKTQKGFLVESWTCWQGSNSGRRVLIYYSDTWPKTTDLDARYNSYYDNGQLLYEHASTTETSTSKVKILSKGHKVQ